VFHGILAFISSGLLIGMALFMYYLIEPQKTFIESNVTGTQDPIRAAVGVTLFIGFAFLLIITCESHSSCLRTRGTASKNFLAFSVKIKDVKII
jgi:hypothetical protein